MSRLIDLSDLDMRLKLSPVCATKVGSCSLLPDESYIVMFAEESLRAVSTEHCVLPRESLFLGDKTNPEG